MVAATVPAKPAKAALAAALAQSRALPPSSAQLSAATALPAMALLTAAAPAAGTVLATAGGAKALYTAYTTIGKAVSVVTHGNIKEQNERSQAVLKTEDLYIADLLEKNARIKRFIGPATPASTDPLASLRDLMNAIQGFEGKLDNLTAPKQGGDFSTADQLRRAADELAQLCAKLGDDLGKINGATSSAAGTVKQISDLMAAQGEPPDSTPGLTSAVRQVQALQGTLTGTVAPAAQPVPALVTQIKADFQSLGGSSGTDPNAIKTQIANYDTLTRNLQNVLGQLKQLVSEFDDAKEQHLSEISPLRERVRLDVTGADDMVLYDAKAQTIRRMEPGVGNIGDEAFTLLKKADGNLRRWRNALGDDPNSGNAKPFDIKTACSIGPAIQSVTTAVAAAGTAVRDLGGKLDGLNGAFQRRKAALDKIAQIDGDSLTKGPDLVAFFKKANQPDNAKAAQGLIDRANARQSQLPQEQAAVQQAVTSLGTIKSNVAGIVSTLGGAQ